MISQESFFFCRFHLRVIPGLERLRIDQAVVPLEASCADEGLLARMNQDPWRHVTSVMRAAGIPEGPHRCPKGLRHGYAIHALSKNVPLNMVPKWMGRFQMETTAIYAMPSARASSWARCWLSASSRHSRARQSPRTAMIVPPTT